ncbi:MAG TPA: hypothetical protein VF559_07110 [Caulobacteraceae bacterium]|jgi:hypothetical protein
MLYLHIGFHKAGSTTLQAFLKANTAQFAGAGLLYPDIGREAHHDAHHALAASLRPVRADSEQTARLWSDLRELALGHPGDVAISSEGLDAVDPAPLGRLIEGVPVKVICYLRELPGRVVSIYNQATKNGNSTVGFDRFFKRELRRLRTPSAPRLKAYAELFGPENVRVRSLDAAVLEGGELTADFLAALGLGADAASRLQLETVAPENRSAGWRTVEILRSLNADADWLDPAEAEIDADNPASVFGALMRAAMAAEARLGWDERGRYLSAEQIERGVAAHNADVAEVEALGLDARLTRISAADYRPREFLPDISLLSAKETSAFYREMVRDLGAQIMAKPWRKVFAGLAEPPPPDPERQARRDIRSGRRG